MDLLRDNNQIGHQIRAMTMDDLRYQLPANLRQEKEFLKVTLPGKRVGLDEDRGSDLWLSLIHI